jgi:tellurite methyltransferase
MRSILLVFLLLAPLSLTGCFESTGSKYSLKKNLNAFQKVTGEDIETDRARWDSLYTQSTYVFGKEPAEVLKSFVDVIPVGRALDIAMGEGRNAVFLAKRGFSVEGVDLSEVALRRARKLARENQVEIETVNADLNTYQIKPNVYDVIVNIDYLQRSLIPQIKRGLKSQGVVIFENLTIDQLSNPNSSGLRRDILLQRGELKEMFKDFRILSYNESNDGKNAKATLVAVKP